MSDFSVRVVRIDSVADHPNADRLSINRILGFETISAKNADGGHLYESGDLVAYVPEAALLPEYMLRLGGFWDDVNRRGILSGPRGNRVKAIRLRGIVSQGLVFPVVFNPHENAFYVCGRQVAVADEMGIEDLDVTELLGITKYEPSVPVRLAGEQTGCRHTRKYDFESIQRRPNLFEPGEVVVCLEKLHGTCFQIGYVPGLGIADAFGDGNIYVTSKGLGGAGRVIRNNDANAGNLYVRMFHKLNEIGFAEKLATLSKETGGAEIRVFGEIFGVCVQDLTYGTTEPSYRVFDITVADVFLPARQMSEAARLLGAEPVPFLYEGPFSLARMTELRDGRDCITGSHIREGIVIRSSAEAIHPRYGRKIAKFVSPDYLLRKGETTEFQ